MSIFIQEVLGLLNRNQKKITLDRTKDWFQFGKLYQTSSLNNKSGYTPKMDPFVIKWGDFICQATEDLTRTLPGQGNLGYIPVYTDPSGSCNWDTLKNSIITQNTLNSIINIAGDLTVTGTSSLNGNVNLGNNIGDVIRLYGTLYDNAGNGPLPNQVLVGQAGGQVFWQNDDVVETLTLGAIWVGNTSNLKQELPIGPINQVLISNGTTLVYGSSLILAPIGNTPNANAATFIGNTLNLEPASASFGGIVTTTTQSFDGSKTFIKDIIVNNITVGRGGGNIATNITVGTTALNANTTGSNNTAIGFSSLQSNISGSGNIAIGFESLKSNISNTNIGIGVETLKSNTTGSNNTAIGHQSLKSNITGDNNLAVGFLTLEKNTFGEENTAIGYAALNENTTGIKNLAIGHSALISNLTGNENIAIGYNAGLLISTGNNNVILGSNTDTLNPIDINSIIIGNGIVGLGSNTVVIGDDSITSTVLKGLVTAPLTTNALIAADTTGKSLVTKEYVALVFLDEGNGNGIARSDRNPAFFGNIGLDAFDISFADGVDSPTTDNGATGEQSFAAGISVRSRNYLSSSFGYLINNNGEGSFDTGYNLKDTGYTNFVTGMGHDVTSANSTVVGQASNIIVSGIDDYNSYPTKPLFVVGNGTIQNADPDFNVLTRSDAFIVRMNGLATLPSVTNALINADTTGKAVTTKEYVDSITRPYKVYTALLTQNGIGAPQVLSLLENTLGFTPTFSRALPGTYIINLPGVNTSICYWNVTSSRDNLMINTTSATNALILYTINTNTMAREDDLITSFTPIEIRVYN